MPTIIPDLIDGTKGVSDAQGLTVTRPYYLDISDIINLSAEEKVVEALATTGIPKFGNLHPKYPQLQVTDIEAIPWSQCQFRVTVVYGTINISLVPDDTKPALQNVGTSSQEIETNVDKDGKPILVFYTNPITGEKAGGPTDISGGKVGGGKGVGGKIKVFKPLTIVKFQRFELNSPLLKSIQYGSTINSLSWLGAQPRTWMCLRIDGERQVRGGTVMYMVSYEFQFKLTTYQTAAVYTNPDGSFPSLVASDLIPDVNGYGNGITYVKGFDEADFNQLKLV